MYHHRRKALHQYDPADLAQAFTDAAEQKEPVVDTKTVKGQELAIAHEKGLLVDIVQQSEQESSPTSVAFRSDKLLDNWEQPQDDLDDAVLDDSDDEML